MFSAQFSETYVVGLCGRQSAKKIVLYTKICTYILKTRFTKTVDVKIYIRKSFLIAIDGTVIKLTSSFHSTNNNNKKHTSFAIAFSYFLLYMYFLLMLHCEQVLFFCNVICMCINVCMLYEFSSSSCRLLYIQYLPTSSQTFSVAGQWPLECTYITENMYCYITIYERLTMFNPVRWGKLLKDGCQTALV